jgi:hypothetical protein
LKLTQENNINIKVPSAALNGRNDEIGRTVGFKTSVSHDLNELITKNRDTSFIDRLYS